MRERTVHEWAAMPYRPSVYESMLAEDMAAEVERSLSPPVSVRSLRVLPAQQNRRSYSVEGKLGNMKSRVGRIVLIIVGVIALVIGVVFAGQGMNLISGSSMTGDRMWLYIGLILAVVGIVLVMLGLRRPGRGRTSR
jgi:tetrahydromethanopterin S-methyltransferase subunit B